DPLRADDAIEGDRGPADDASAWLDVDRRASQSAALLPHRLRERTRVVGETHDFLSGAQWNGEPSAHRDLRDRSLRRRAHVVREGDERTRKLAVGSGVTHLGTEVRVDPDEREAFRADDLARVRQRVARRDRHAELAVQPSGPKVRERVHRDAGRDAQPYRLRQDPVSDKRTQALDGVHTGEHDAAAARTPRTHQRLAGLLAPWQL